MNCFAKMLTTGGLNSIAPAERSRTLTTGAAHLPIRRRCGASCSDLHFGSGTGTEDQSRTPHRCRTGARVRSTPEPFELETAHD